MHCVDRGVHRWIESIGGSMDRWMDGLHDAVRKGRQTDKCVDWNGDGFNQEGNDFMMIECVSMPFDCH